MRRVNRQHEIFFARGRAVRLRFRLADADLYSMQFLPYRPDPPMPEPGDRIDPARYADR